MTERLERPESEVSGTEKIVRHVAAIFTGGTIAVSPTEAGAVTPGLRGKDILSKIPEAATHLEGVAVSVHDFSTLPSPHISPEIMLTLAQFVRSVQENVDGVVITHGTDSLEETAFFLDMVLSVASPVALTGSMHTSTETAWDGGRNLLDACAVAASTSFRGAGVLVVMDGHVHAASEVTKLHTLRTDTFHSMDFGPLGSVGVLAGSAPLAARMPRHRVQIAVDDAESLPHVELLKSYAGMSDRLLLATLQMKADGIVIEAMGQGNVPPGLLHGIAAARDAGVPVVITSRCTSGPVSPYYTYEGAGRELEQLGCLFAPYLTGPKARLALMLLIASQATEAEMQRAFGVG